MTSVSATMPERVETSFKLDSFLGLSFSIFFERFAFYGIRWALVLYFVWEVLPADFQAKFEGEHLYSAFLALMLSLGVLGAYIADRCQCYLNAARVGVCLMALGVFMIVMPDPTAFRIGLSCLVLGNALYRPGSLVLFSKTLGAQEAKQDVGLTLMYFLVNLAGFLAPLVTQYLATRVFGAENKMALQVVFVVAGLSLLLSLACLHWGSKKLLTRDEFSDSVWQFLRTKTLWIGILVSLVLVYQLFTLSKQGLTILSWASLLVAVALLFADAASHKNAWKRLLLFMLALVLSFAWAIANEFLQVDIERIFMNWIKINSSLAAISPMLVATFSIFAIFVVTPLLVGLISLFSKSKKYPDLWGKWALALLLNVLFFCMLVIASRDLFAGLENTFSLTTTSLVMAYLLQAGVEVMVTTLGYSAVLNFASTRRLALAFAALLLANRLGSQAAGFLMGEFPSLISNSPTEIHQHFEWASTGFALLAGVLLFVIMVVYFRNKKAS
ncbi:hypothetical protein RF679_03700 [Undibacterium cyanobacteriorum]|uniref:Major facilitator superfamily (MFS) profile domain-containing protein n=1 Tax=Undibacterium cyanobacteriorum TaxID=3073561 RepID=A0ABY9RKB0_9BURK|nr:hypothetical protein [Undibacterium sp. 20NA77.5]WMW81391.1 hypothetical protein RF679_03700 [Undibacterium sp. 20NA77.5]